MRRYNLPGSGGAAEHFHYLTDDQHSVVALQRASDGEIVERISYSEYGAPLFENTDSASPDFGQERDGSFYGNPYAFTGRRWEPGLQLYDYRFRWFDPSTGRFITRDPIGIWGDGINVGNGYTYVGNNPWTYVDPFGLEGRSWCEGTIFDGALWKAGVGPSTFCRPKQNLGNTSTTNQQILGEIEAGATAANEYAQWGVETGVLVASAYLPGPEDAAFAVLSATKIGAAGKSALSSLLKYIPTLSSAVRFSDLAPCGKINSKNVNFSQFSASSVMSNGYRIDQLYDVFKRDRVPANMPPIHIYEKDGRIFSLDNRRLAAAKAAGVELPYVKVDPSDPKVAREIRRKHNPIRGLGEVIVILDPCDGDTTKQMKTLKNDLKNVGLIE